MKSKVVILPFFVVLVVLAHNNDAFIGTAIGLFKTGMTVFKGATKVVGLIKQGKGILDMFKGTKQNSAASQEMLNTMNNLHEQQMQQNNENYMNTMLKLNGIEGKFDGLSSQVTDMQGKLVDISGMLDGMDGKLNTITDLVFNIDGKMDKFSNQVI
jgi:hypothetical protein